jgi:hypothetical protein
MANEQILNLGTPLVLETTASTVLSNDAFYEAADDDRQPGDNTGYPVGIFELNTASTSFSAAPTAGAAVHLYEQKINSDGNDAPDVDASYRYDYIGTFHPDLSTGVQQLSITAPIHRYGGKYWLEWVDGGAGSANLSSGWELKLIPAAIGT